MPSEPLTATIRGSSTALVLILSIDGEHALTDQDAGTPST